jgi:hypothetical protein
VENYHAQRADLAALGRVENLPMLTWSFPFLSKDQQAREDKKHQLGTEPMQLLAPRSLQLFSTEYYLFISTTRAAAAPTCATGST